MAAILNSGTNGNWEKGICGICPAGCWVEVQKEGERIIDIRPDESHALGMICRRGQHSPEIIYSEHRLKYPMKRVGAKGTFEFERIESSFRPPRGEPVDRLR